MAFERIKGFYRSITSANSAARVTSCLVGVIFVYSIARIFLLPTGDTKRNYYTINFDKREYVRVQGYSSPIVNPFQLGKYVESIVGKIYTYDSLNYIDKYNNIIAKYFERDALRKFFKSVEPRLNVVNQNGIAVSAVPLAAVQINDYGYLGGEFVFNVSVPIKINYASKMGVYSEDTLVSLTLLRVEPTKDLHEGLKILSLKEAPFKVQSIYKLKEVD